MPKSRTRKKSKDARASIPLAPRAPSPLVSLLGSDWKSPGASFAAAMTTMASQAAEIEDSFDRDFAIRIGHRTIRWEFWPQCVAATRSGTRCLQTSVVDNPGPYRDGAHDVENRETYGSSAAEALRRLLTQRCHLHDNATPAAVEFEGQVSADNEDWLGELQQVAGVNAIRAEQTREANRQRLIDTECPTCGVMGSLKCLQSSGRTKLKGFHMPRLQAAFGQTNQGHLPIV